MAGENATTVYGASRKLFCLFPNQYLPPRPLPRICREFIEANAVDELELYIAPEMLGNGVRLFVTDPKNPDVCAT
jgi:hypothetical protein